MCLLIDKNSKCGSLNGVWVYPTSQHQAIRISKFENCWAITYGASWTLGACETHGTYGAPGTLGNN